MDGWNRWRRRRIAAICMRRRSVSPAFIEESPIDSIAGIVARARGEIRPRQDFPGVAENY